MTYIDELKRNVSTLEGLKQYVKLTLNEEKKLQKVIETHPMSITRYYMSLIDKKDPNDPIRRMAVPSLGELNLSGSYDTSGEAKNTKMPGLQHKYPQTALILATNRCATYCRYCFRKRLVGLPSDEILRRFSDAVKYIEKHSEINNVLITGGDPFILPTKVIGRFLEMLSPIPHLNFIRFGTRTPVMFPDRILEDKKLLKLLEKYSLKNRRIYVVTQFNHPREITRKSTKAVNSLIRSGVIVNNQTVLLERVNDNPDILAELQNKLTCIGVNPYYVFQCRPVKRVKRQFQVPLYRGYEIVENAKKKLNGHSKRFRYIMSHRTGKIEIVGIMGNDIYFKYHQAKDPKNIGKFFKRKLNKTAGWLDDLK
ncbi:MAG: KamA family radical SAM protein [Candidatus Thermoplasmatota archaeon]|nr:KamA family radical SAM protein [Candidatus Thermoplasmatota archaeon]MBU4189739.1 KamA family radical SAM protein [Candidatus Thermoplasmatota archaeon]MBU4256133.1 KamA family radical SAM protein [Candidatus Thermoplasmatota archaeon]